MQAYMYIYSYIGISWQKVYIYTDHAAHEHNTYCNYIGVCMDMLLTVCVTRGKQVLYIMSALACNILALVKPPTRHCYALHIPSSSYAAPVKSLIDPFLL